MELHLSSLITARVVRQDRSLLTVRTAEGDCLAKTSGNLEHASSSAVDLPIVGDWVSIRPPEDGTTLIQAVLPRSSLLVRGASGDTTEPQPIAANVDVVFIVAGLDDDLNLRRLERYLALTWDSGARPVVVLNKCELQPELDLAPIEALGAKVLAVSARTGHGIEALQSEVAAGQTAALLGPSGVGKSTLTNRLLQVEHFQTSEVRGSDAKGRHTTTHRELVTLPNGGFLIDGPGMRELALWESGGLAMAFEDVQGFAAACRFNDCTHQEEPGCGVRAAIENGALPAERFESFEKLQRELAHLERKQDAHAAQEQKRLYRQLTVAGWERSRAKRRF